MPAAGGLIQARLMIVVEFPPERRSLTDRFFGTLGRIFKPGAGRGTGTAISGNSGRAGCDLRLLQFPTKTHGPPRKAGYRRRRRRTRPGLRRAFL